MESFSASKKGVTRSKVSELQIISNNVIPAAYLAVVLELGFTILRI